MKVLICFTFIFSCLALPSNVFGERFNVVDFGAVGDGETLNTIAFGNALNAASEAGGGTVYVPAGRFVSGTIELKSNITLYLEAGAIIAGSSDFDDFPLVNTRNGYEHAGLIYGRDLENISIQGRGTIDGQGKPWWDRIRFLRANNFKVDLLTPSEKRTLELNKGTRNKDALSRPCLIEFFNCKNIELSGITIINSPKWTVHPVFCENINITGISIDNPYEVPNGDGINPDSCNGVRISNCYLSTGDDCVTIKSGFNEEGRKDGKPCENITITNCVMLRGHGGVVIGSEMSGGVRNVVVSNCIFNGTDRGIRLKAPRGRGNVIEDVSFNNIVMKNIRQAAIVFDMMYYDTTRTARAFDETTPVIKNIFIDNVRGQNVRDALYLIGLEESPLLNIRLSNVNVNAQTAGIIENVDGLTIKDSNIFSDDENPLEFRIVKSLKLDNFEVRNKNTETPVFSFNNAENVFFSGYNLSGGSSIPFYLNGEIKDIRIEYGDRKFSLSKGSFSKGTKLNDRLEQIR